MKKTLTLIALSAVAFSAVADTMPFTYNFEGAEPKAYRKFKAKPDHDYETIDVAIFIDGSLAGKKVTSISVPVTGDVTALKDFSAFMTTKLATRSQGALKFNKPDICSVAATLEGNTLKATFAEPYTITEKGVYVGYSVTDTSMEAQPVATVGGYTLGAFYYRGSEANARWTDLGQTQGTSSAMTVYLDGTFDKNCVKLSQLPSAYSAIDEDGSVEVSLVTFGTESVKSIGYTVTLDGKTGTFDVTLPAPVEAKLGMPFTATLGLPAVDRRGDFDFSVSIDRINGQDNASASKTGNATLGVLPFVPKNNPLVEEYTGLRCGWCPGGYVTLRQMHDKYGFENFVAISYHTMMESGCMVHLDELPMNPSGLPTSQINRAVNAVVLDIPSSWATQRRNIVPGEVTVTLDWADDTHTEMVATARTRFIDDLEASPYLVSFCVVADNLSNPEWKQYNAYNDPENAGEKCTGDYWDLFIGKDKDVAGLVFDDIAVLYPDQQGVAGSLPGEIKGCEWYESTFRFKPADIVNVRKERIATDANKLRVIAIINDTKTGKVVNSASSLYVDGTGASGIDGIEADDSDSAPVYYNISGQRVDKPGKGLFIRLQNGRATKILR